MLTMVSASTLVGTGRNLYDGHADLVTGCCSAARHASAINRSLRFTFWCSVTERQPMTVSVDLTYPFTGRWIVQNSPATRVPSHGTDLFATSYARSEEHTSELQS